MTTRPRNDRIGSLVILAAILAMALLLMLPHLARGQTTRPALIVAAWAQPTSSFSKWKAAGVNTLFGAETEGGKITKADWEKAAAAAGLWFVTLPGSDLATEARQPFRLGWMQLDEPDMSNHRDLPGNTLKDLEARYKACKAAAPALPVYLNLGGPAFDNVAYDGAKYRPDIKANRPYWHRAADGGYMAWADVIGFDYHLWTTNRAGRFDITRRLMDRCHEWSGGKPFFVYVESCTQGTGLPFSADAFEAQVNQAIAYAAMRGYKLAGLIEFATAPNGQGGWPAAFDAAPADVKARRPIVYQRLNAAVGAQVWTAPAEGSAELQRANAKLAELWKWIDAAPKR